MATFTFGKGGPLRIKAQVNGQAKLAKKLKGVSDATAFKCAEAITEAALALDQFAKGYATSSVDTGRLRSSIRPVFTRGGLAAEVGTDVKYAAFVEFGTGPLGASTNTQPLPAGYAHGGPYFPPPSALAPWARRHGRDPYQVARAIFEKGGTRARPFLGPAWAKVEPTLRLALQDAVRNATKGGKI